MKKTTRKLDIYIDESGNFDNYSKYNLVYSVAFVMVDSSDDNIKPIALFEKKLSNIVGGEHFVHTGNLVRGEKPYKGMQLSERQDLFYILFLLAKHSKYKVICSTTEKKEITDKMYEGITDSVIDVIRNNSGYISSYDEIIIHYDNGQDYLKGVLLTAFKLFAKNASFVKTTQQEEPFMQVADLFSYFELIKYKIEKACLSKHEEKFFGLSRKIKNDYLKQLEDKFL